MRPGEESQGEVVPAASAEFALWWLGRLLRTANAWGWNAPLAEAKSYVLFGSAVLYLHGIREPDSVGDIDVFVSREVWGKLLAAGPEVVTVETPRAGDPPFLECVLSTPIHFFYEWTARDAAWITAEECFATAEVVNGWRCASLQTIRRHKEKSYEQNMTSDRHQKHARDLVAIDKHEAALRLRSHVGYVGQDGEMPPLHTDVYPDGRAAWPGSY